MTRRLTKRYFLPPLTKEEMENMISEEERVKNAYRVPHADYHILFKWSDEAVNKHAKNILYRYGVLAYHKDNPD